MKDIEKLKKGTLNLTNLETGEIEINEVYYPQEVAEKVNEIIDYLNSKKDQLL